MPSSRVSGLVKRLNDQLFDRIDSDAHDTNLLRLNVPTNDTGKQMSKMSSIDQQLIGPHHMDVTSPVTLRRETRYLQVPDEFGERPDASNGLPEYRIDDSTMQTQTAARTAAHEGDRHPDVQSTLRTSISAHLEMDASSVDAERGDIDWTSIVLDKADARSLLRDIEDCLRQATVAVYYDQIWGIHDRVFEVPAHADREGSVCGPLSGHLQVKVSRRLEE